MKLSTALADTGDPSQAATQAHDLEAAGIDMIWVAELYTFDAVSALGYFAATTSRVELAAGILPIYSRTPTLTAMTAAGLDAVSGGRFVLGLGTSGPRVIEGWHGVRQASHPHPRADRHLPARLEARASRLLHRRHPQRRPTGLHGFRVHVDLGDLVARTACSRCWA